MRAIQYRGVCEESSFREKYLSPLLLELFFLNLGFLYWGAKPLSEEKSLRNLKYQFNFPRFGPETLELSRVLTVISRLLAS